MVDVLRFSTTGTDAVAAGDAFALDDAAHAVSINGAAVAAAAADTGALVLLGCLRNASAVAAVVLAEQERRGDRTSVAIIAAGELTGRDAGAPLRFSIEDQLAAGAIVDALAERGIDHTSPDAAVACEAFRGLRRAVRHLLTASGSGRELAATGTRRRGGAPPRCSTHRRRAGARRRRLRRLSGVGAPRRRAQRAR